MGRKKCEWEKEVGGECGLVGWGGSVRWVEVGRREMLEKGISGKGRECGNKVLGYVVCQNSKHHVYEC